MEVIRIHWPSCELSSAGLSNFARSSIVANFSQRSTSLSARQQSAICRLVEADIERLTDDGGRGAEIAGGAEKVGDQRLVVGRRFLHVESDVLFALGDDNGVDGFGEGEGFVAAFAGLARINDGGDADLVLLKEPLSVLAGRSGFAEIHPVDGLIHDRLEK